MLREFAALIEALTAARPLVLGLEDLHWSDPSTVDLLAVLAQRREPARLLVIGTYRATRATLRLAGREAIAFRGRADFREISAHLRDFRRLPPPVWQHEAATGRAPLDSRRCRRGRHSWCSSTPRPITSTAIAAAASST